MIRFNNSKTSKNKKLLIIISDLIRKIFGGDRVKRLSLVMIKISKDIYKKDKKKMNILDFGCGSMEISKKLEKLSYVKKIVGVDTFPGNSKLKKCDILNTMIFLKKIKKILI